VLIALIVVPFLVGIAALVPAFGQAAAAAQRGASPPDVMKWGFIAASFAAAASALGAAYAVAVVGGAAVGAVAEKPETAGRVLIFVGLAEGIAIYGLIIAIMILGYLS
jgi:V/A-type H+-transporting ATPase subunit K